MRQGPTRPSILGRFRVLPTLLVVAGLGTSARPASGDEPAYPASRLGFRTAPLLLLSRSDVRADLRLDANQAASADRAITDLWTRAAALRGKTGPEAIAARRSIDEAQRAWIEGRLSDAQRRRLTQIDLQWEGASALISRPIVAEGLGLTPDQRSTLDHAVADRDRRRSPGRTRTEDERALARQAFDLLTPDQRDRWKAMLGEPFVPQVAGVSGTGNANPTR